jgi:hypothetical protein
MPRPSNTQRLAAAPEDAMDEEDGLRLVCSRAAGTAVAAGRLGRAAVDGDWRQWHQFLGGAQRLELREGRYGFGLRRRGWYLGQQVFLATDSEML